VSDAARGPLSGIRVLDFTQVIAGPYACMTLADMGAEVIKVEPPGGEQWRLVSQFVPKESKAFQSLNRGKLSLVLDLEHPLAQEAVHRLIPSIDVVVVNFRPDVPARLRVDYETLRAIRPDLVYLSNTAFGSRGPDALKPGYDIVAQAVTGLMVSDSKLARDGTPRPMSPAVADYATGLAIVGAVCAALYHRERTGEGQFMETSLLATALSLQGSVVMENPKADVQRNVAREKRREMRRNGATFEELVEARKPLGGGLFYRCYLTADGAVAVGALSKSLRAKVRRAVGTDFLAQDAPDYDPRNPEFIARSREATKQVEATLRSKTTREWLEIFEREGVPAGPLKFPEDMADDPQVEANALMLNLEHEVSGPQRVVGPLVRFPTFKGDPASASPRLGAHTDRLLREAGYDAEDIIRLRRVGAVE
jgi:crotonobetainyl-CoA:carnitine CoA-transferase CaiB-like acyl-CoA transferase